MKQTLKRRICAAILCPILLLGLVGCGKGSGSTPNGGEGTLAKPLSDSKKPGRPSVDGEETANGAESLARVRGDLEYDGRLTGAAAYLGLREKGNSTDLTDWLRENCADLTSELPFLLEIPSERVLGAGYGKLFCIVPRDENTSLAVNHVTWRMMGNGLHPVADEVLYREEYAQPVLLFVDPEGIRFSLDAEVALFSAGKNEHVVNRPPERFETYKGPLAIAVRKGLADGTVDPAADIKQLYYNAYDSILGMMQRLTVGVPSVNELDAHTRLRAMCAMFTREFAAKKD